MRNEGEEPKWQDIQHKGYLHIKGFVSARELEVLRKDWSARAGAARGSVNGNYPIVDISQTVVWRFHSKMKAVSEAISAATGICADVDAGGHAYFATQRELSSVGIRIQSRSLSISNTLNISTFTFRS